MTQEVKITRYMIEFLQYPNGSTYMRSKPMKGGIVVNNKKQKPKVPEMEMGEEVVL